MGLCEEEYADNPEGIHDVQTFEMLHLSGGWTFGGWIFDRLSLSVLYDAWKCGRTCAVADFRLYVDYFYDRSCGGCDRGEQEAASGYPVSREKSGV